MRITDHWIGQVPTQWRRARIEPFITTGSAITGRITSTSGRRGRRFTGCVQQRIRSPSEAEVHGHQQENEDQSPSDNQENSQDGRDRELTHSSQRAFASFGPLVSRCGCGCSLHCESVNPHGFAVTFGIIRVHGDDITRARS
ncbi:hypothetical protein TCAL_16233 [Tigriopus californicus]|uniref:Uncharacterized protein n=1 Tax=Tigriopus californicus TaxID=6832 RepID=A0A553P2U2_TIGCA|nr:hypothetical protein TCAL_16233 [Tigriopus californicus]